jgi:DNA replication licensing factor MCM6
MSIALRVPVADEAGETVKTRFIEFLETFREEVNDVTATTQHRLLSDYMAQIATMMQNNKTTVYVNFQHVLNADLELAEAIEVEYYRFEPYLRSAVQECIGKDNPHYVMDVDRGQVGLVWFGF